MRHLFVDTSDRMTGWGDVDDDGDDDLCVYEEDGSKILYISRSVPHSSVVVVPGSNRAIERIEVDVDRDGRVDRIVPGRRELPVPVGIADARRVDIAVVFWGGEREEFRGVEPRTWLEVGR